MSRVPFDVETLGAPQWEVGARLRAIREAKNLSLREFAKRVSHASFHVSHTAVVKYEMGGLKITPDYLERVSEAFNVPYGWLVSGVVPEDISSGSPIVLEAGLGFLPRYLQRSVGSRLEQLADWCGTPPGPIRSDFYREVGRLLRAPFSEPSGFLRSWDELSERELSVYVATQFANLRMVLRRFVQEDFGPGLVGEEERAPQR